MTEVMHKGSDSDTSPLKATAAATTTNRRAIRGRAAALLANNDSSSDSDDNSGPISKSKITTAANSKGKSQSSGGGIYYQVLNQTKKEIKENHLKLDAIVDSMKLNEKEKSAVKKASDSEENDDFAQADDEPWIKKKKSQNKQEEEAIPPSPPSPPSPPPPSFLAASKSKRKSTNKLDKQLKELEQIADSKSKVYDILNSSDRFNDDDDDIFNRITVKVLTKDGVCTIETNKNESFSKVYDELAKKLKTPADSIVLMLKERVINIQDTPSSIGLKIYDIIDCGKVTSKKMVQEKIQVVNDENDESEPPANCIRVIFQTEEGRKSRIKFLILKTETFDNVLKKYCEKRNLSAEDKYLLEFDGERVDLSETPVDLDLDGDEIFDVKKGSKSIMQKVAANQKAYEYDDDILPL